MGNCLTIQERVPEGTRLKHGWEDRETMHARSLGMKKTLSGRMTWDVGNSQNIANAANQTAITQDFSSTSNGGICSPGIPDSGNGGVDCGSLPDPGTTGGGGIDMSGGGAAGGSVDTSGGGTGGTTITTC